MVSIIAISGYSVELFAAGDDHAAKGGRDTSGVGRESKGIRGN
jgi:hypothetical protein